MSNNKQTYYKHTKTSHTVIQPKPYLNLNFALLSFSSLNFLEPVWLKSLGVIHSAYTHARAFTLACVTVFLRRVLIVFTAPAVVMWVLRTVSDY